LTRETEPTGVPLHRKNMRRILLLLVVATIATACGSSQKATPAPTTEQHRVADSAARQLPPQVLAWLRSYTAHSSPGRATSASWVLTTHDKSGPFVGGAIFYDKTPVYLFDIKGHFVWDHSCPPRSAPSACISRGRHEVLTLDPNLLQIKDFGVEAQPLHLATLGAVGHVAL
jgi:hypothetical protein